MRFVVGLFVGIVVGVTGTILFHVSGEKLFAFAVEWKLAKILEPSAQKIDEPSVVSTPVAGSTSEPTDEIKTLTSSPSTAPSQYSSWITPFISAPGGRPPRFIVEDVVWATVLMR